MINIFETNFLIIGLMLSVCLISYFFVTLLTPFFIKLLVKKGNVVEDYHKLGKPKIPRPAGPILFGGIAVSLIVLYLFMHSNVVAAILLTTFFAFLVGYIDDKRVMPGWFKPVALMGASLPLIFFAVHENSLYLIFSSAYIPILYIPLILIAIPVIGNTINSIDVLNGVVTGFMIITMIPLLISIYLFSNINIFIMALSLFFVTIALYRYHKFPSKIFPGDSGTLAMGSMYGALAIAGNSEVIGIIALLPAILNSFLFLASVKKIVEHRKISSRPTVMRDDFKLEASKDKNAPITLLRLIVINGPLGEKEIGYKLFKLAIFSSLLSIVSIGIEYYFFMMR